MPFVDFNELVNNDKIPLGLEMWYFKMPHPSQEALSKMRASFRNPLQTTVGSHSMLN